MHRCDLASAKEENKTTIREDKSGGYDIDLDSDIDIDIHIDRVYRDGHRCRYICRQAFELTFLDKDSARRGPELPMRSHKLCNRGSPQDHTNARFPESSLSRPLESECGILMLLWVFGASKQFCQCSPCLTLSLPGSRQKGSCS